MMAINGIGLPPQAVAQQAGQQNIAQQEQALFNATVEAAQGTSANNAVKESTIAQQVKALTEGDESSGNPADAKNDSEDTATNGHLGGLLDVSA